MYLRGLKLKRFRSAVETNISFQPDLTVLVGENNGGKSNIVDAIRLLTLPLSGRRDRYAEEDDLCRGGNESFFEIEGRYAGLGNVLKGLLISAVPDPTKDDAIFGLLHHIRSADHPRGRTSHWAGRFDTNEPERGANDVIRHVYLPPLRNAQQELGSGSATRITALLKNFLETEEEEQAFVNAVKRSETPHPAITSVNDEIGSALGELTGGVRRQSASLDFESEALFDVARDLRFKLADEGLTAEDIRLSGLGYANLLYMVAVVVELSKAREADLTLVSR